MEIEYIKREFELSELTNQTLNSEVSSVYRYIQYCVENKKIEIDASYIYVKRRRNYKRIAKRAGIKGEHGVGELISFFLSRILKQDLSNRVIIFGSPIIENIIISRTRDTSPL